MIAESTADRLWGSGRSLGDPLCLDTSNWTSQGLLGQILESIREEALQTRTRPPIANFGYGSFTTYPAVVPSNNNIREGMIHSTSALPP